ncbi:OLC1v1001826C2 [Oldenlandia corymbosa var. corymbosa]|nr:OLC1v1001826C2 [Oldenlandia corymbosa var. corymbosa]
MATAAAAETISGLELEDDINGSVVDLTKGLEMTMGSFYISKDDPSKPQGQDAHFLLPEFQTFGLADGVGGWSKRGIDSGEYSRELIGHAVYSIQTRSSNPNPKSVLNEAFTKTEAQGSSTACIVTLDGGAGKLRAVNIGDSGFVHIRGGVIIYRSPVQQHSFNRPYQLGKTNDGMDLVEEIVREVEDGDVIVAGTDGLFDNLHDTEIKGRVRDGRETYVSPEILAWNIADFAYQQSMNPYSVSPYRVNSNLVKGEAHYGGKPDDITVIVAYISR